MTATLELIANHVPADQRLNRHRAWMRNARYAGLLALVAAGFGVYEECASRWRYAAAVQEADRRDPGWRHGAIQKARVPVPPEQNSAFLVLEADRLTGQRYPDPGLAEGIGVPALEADTWLAADRLARMRTSLNEIRPAIEKARTIAEHSAGRFEVDWSTPFLAHKLRHPSAAHRIARWLSVDSAVRAQDGDIDGALRSAKAILNVGRSMGDEPLMISQLTRLQISMRAAAAVEQALAHGTPSPRPIDELQKAFQEELAFPHVVIALRGERAAIDRTFEEIVAGKYDGPELFSPIPDGPLSRTFPTRRFRDNRAWLLTALTKAVDAANAPEPGRNDRLNVWDNEVTRTLHSNEFTRVRYFPARAVLPPVFVLKEMARQHQAQLRCTIAAIAAERVRRVTGRFPRSLVEFEPALPAGAGIDPFSSSSLRVKAVADGVMIYSWGPDLKDNGGRRGSGTLFGPGTDLGFHLRDVAHRRPPTGDGVELPREVFQSHSP